jgi:hypothetical protein
MYPLILKLSIVDNPGPVLSSPPPSSLNTVQSYPVLSSPAQSYPIQLGFVGSSPGQSCPALYSRASLVLCQ